MADLAFDGVSISKAEKVHKLYSQLETQRSGWLTDWVEIADHVDPMMVRQSRSDKKGQRSRGNIVDNTAALAWQVLRAGLMSGATSPARPWIRLTIADEELAEHEPVKEWLSEETKRLLFIFRKSNTYTTLSMLYGQMGLIGSSCALTMESAESVIGHYTSPIGEFCLGGDYMGKVDTVGRKFEKSVHETVREFGLENVSETVRNLYDQGNYYTGVPIIHVVEPRRERQAGRRDKKNKPWASCYIEEGQSKEYDFLRESGYDDFPGLCPRWDRRSGDVYGTGPGHFSLGDTLQLQHMQKQKSVGIEYMVRPPVQAPSSFRENEMDLLPGGTSFGDMNTPNNRIQSIWDVPINLQHLLEDIYDCRGRIEAAYHKPVFAMFADMDRSGQMTATEVAERHEEKMLLLGPVVERLHNELLQPLVENTFARMVQVGMTAPPPPELEGRDLQVEFVSVLAQAQRAIGVNAADRFVNSLGIVAQMKPDVLDKFDSDAWAEMYADSLGVDPKMIIGNERVGFIREARMEQQRKEEQLMSIQAQAEAAQKLGSVKTDERNAATDLLNQVSGYGSPSGVEV